jgi:cell division topological specificity factor
MKLFNLFRRRGSAPLARERLQIILSHERATGGQSDLLAILREEILSAIAKHVSIDRDSIQVRLNRGETVSVLEINVEIPCAARMPLVRMASSGDRLARCKTVQLPRVDCPV